MVFPSKTDLLFGNEPRIYSWMFSKVYYRPVSYTSLRSYLSSKMSV